MNTTSKIIGCILMFLAIVAAFIAFFAIDWTLGVLYCSYIVYRLGFYLNEPKIKINL